MGERGRKNKKEISMDLQLMQKQKELAQMISEGLVPLVEARGTPFTKFFRKRES